MWDLFWNVLVFLSGIAIGRMQSSHSGLSNRIDHLDDLISQAYQKRDLMKREWLDAEERAETWKRRYESLVSEKESKIGS